MAKIIDRIKTFFWWNIMNFTWFLGIFSQKVYDQNQVWLMGLSFNENIRKEMKNLDNPNMKALIRKLEKFK